MKPNVPNPTSLAECRGYEYEMYFKEFEPLDKVDIYKQTSDMMCKYIVKYFKTEKRIRIALNKFEELWKGEKVTLRAK